MTKLYIVVPCYNEQEVLPQTAQVLREKTNMLIANGRISADSRVVFVDDGSKDNTWESIETLHEDNPLFCGIKLSRNRGHQNALLAGLMTVRGECDAAVSMDADLQDDVDAIDAMLDEFENGCDVVYGVRSDRRSDSAMKRLTAEGFYKLLGSMGVETVFNHADYRLLSRRALDTLSEFPESNLYLRGLVPQLGYKSGKVTYTRRERAAGKSKYSAGKMLSLAWEGISSMSTRPLELVVLIGAIFGAIGFVLCIAALCMARAVMGILALVVFFGGMQMTAIGIVGQYVGKTYIESKHRPRYVIEKIVK